MKTSNLIFNVLNHASNDNILEYDMFCDRLQTIDFRFITYTLQQRYGWTKQQIEQAIERYQQLLFVLSQAPNQPVVPDRMTDQVLHAHLEMGDRFKQDCLHILGFELTHESKSKMENEGDRRHWLALFAHTQLQLRKNFGMSTKYRFRRSSSSIKFLLPAYCILSGFAKPQSAAALS